MLHKPSDGENVYEISIYNKEVRSLVKENQSHKLFDDHWADSQLHDVVATDEEEARRMVDERYPESDGFVIEALTITEV
ncbi:MAG: hypothetical protein VW338_14680 [Rhodospirillaceae bacterium]